MPNGTTIFTCAGETKYSGTALPLMRMDVLLQVVGATPPVKQVTLDVLRLLPKMDINSPGARPVVRNDAALTIPPLTMDGGPSTIVEVVAVALHAPARYTK